MAWKFNVFTGTFDATWSEAALNGLYVLKAGDTMTGPLVISPSGDTALRQIKT